MLRIGEHGNIRVMRNEDQLPLFFLLSNDFMNSVGNVFIVQVVFWLIYN